MNNKQIAELVLELIGGKENITAYEHCATRLRIIVKDKETYEQNKNEIDNIEGVNGSFYQTGQVQIILGTGKVNKVYDEFDKLVGGSSESAKEAAYENMNTFQKVSRIFGDIFIPIIPVIVATGLFMGLRGLLLNIFPHLGDDFPDILTLTQVLTDTVFIFLPALVAMNAAKRFGGNPILGLVVGLMMVAPMLPNAYEVASGDVDPITFGFIKISGYQGSVLPALIVGIFTAYVEKTLKKFIPDMLDLIVTPFLTLLIGLMMGLFILGPITHLLEAFLLDFFIMVLDLPFGIGGFVIGSTTQIITVTGLHHVLNAIEIGLLEQTGVNPWNGIITLAIVAQGATGIAVALKTKDKKQRAMNISAAVPSFLGITEPVIFGVSLPRLKPFFLGCLAGGIGGMLASIFGLQGSGFGITVIPGLLLYVYDMNQLLLYIILHIVTIAVAVALVFVFWNEDKYQREVRGINEE